LGPRSRALLLKIENWFPGNISCGQQGWKISLWLTCPAVVRDGENKKKNATKISDFPFIQHRHPLMVSRRVDFFSPGSGVMDIYETWFDVNIDSMVFNI
jgi:hypothetical protein